jgi:predicted MPP superfamily phosphohydrolase
MRNVGSSLIFLGVMLLVDLYVFQAIKVVSQGLGARGRILIYAGFWLITAFTVALLASLPYINYDQWQKPVRTYLFATLIGIFLAKLISIPFFLVDDIRRVGLWVYGRVTNPLLTVDASNLQRGEKIARSTFLSWLGVGMGSALLGTLLYGFRNQYNYQVKNLQLAFDNLPEAFKGLRIVQISDIHSGSFMDKSEVAKGVDIINEVQPDLVLFTGDLVNDRATEMKSFIDVFAQLKAPMGVYSTLGNHDYGDYVRWTSKEEKQANLEHLQQVHAHMGWRLLMDEHVVLEKDGHKIGLLGVQNISGRKSFHSYGSLQKAYAGTENLPFKILMSHDPSHWDAEVRTKYPDIDLTLSGHTHGMQFGVEIPGIKWSPVQWVYKQWAGLYEDAKQKLYVNRGFGFIGYPGRVGILPEITVIELA